MSTPLDRLRSFALATLDFTLGTLWRVREDLWQQAIPSTGRGYDSSGSRLWHPGLSIRKAPPVGLHEMVPMLHGRSSKGKGVAVSGITECGGESYKTYFGSIAPAPVPVARAFRGDKLGDGKKPEGHWNQWGALVRNHWKPRIEDDELAALRDFLRRNSME